MICRQGAFFGNQFRQGGLRSGAAAYVVLYPYDRYVGRLALKYLCEYEQIFFGPGIYPSEVIITRFQLAFGHVRMV
jgi:hypothetical protein